jgi:hypothetical protein
VETTTNPTATSCPTTSGFAAALPNKIRLRSKDRSSWSVSSVPMGSSAWTLVKSCLGIVAFTVAYFNLSKVGVLRNPSRSVCFVSLGPTRVCRIGTIRKLFQRHLGEIKC